MRSVSKDEGVFVGVAVGVPNTPSSMKKSRNFPANCRRVKNRLSKKNYRRNIFMSEILTFKRKFKQYFSFLSQPQYVNE